MIIKYAAVIIQDGKLLLVRKKGTKIFISPGGKPNPGETEKDCLCREVREELGVIMTSAEIYRTDYSISVFEDDNIKVTSYLVEISGKPVPSSEIEEIRWVSVADVPSLSVGSIFRDGVIPQLIARGMIK